MGSLLATRITPDITEILQPLNTESTNRIENKNNLDDSLKAAQESGFGYSCLYLKILLLKCNDI
jgi:hypothetical protein